MTASGNYRVHLARHDGRTRLALGQSNLRQTGVRTGREQTQVGTDLPQGTGQRFQDAGNFDEHVAVLRGLHQVLGARKADAGQFAKSVNDPEDELARRSKPGADGRAAQVYHPQPLFALVNAPAIAVKGFGVGAHFAAQRGQHGVLHFRAAYLHHVSEALFGSLKRFLQLHDSRLEPVKQPNRRRAEARWGRCHWSIGAG